MFQTMPYWTLKDALDLIRGLQPESRKFGYHLCLGGGVLNKGESKKDLDLYFLPMGGPNEARPTALISWLEGVWGDSWPIGGGLYPPQEGFPYKQKFQYGDLVIDVFVNGGEVDVTAEEARKRRIDGTGILDIQQPETGGFGIRVGETLTQAAARYRAGPFFVGEDAGNPAPTAAPTPVFTPERLTLNERDASTPQTAQVRAASNPTNADQTWVNRIFAPPDDELRRANEPLLTRQEQYARSRVAETEQAYLEMRERTRQLEYEARREEERRYREMGRRQLQEDALNDIRLASANFVADPRVPRDRMHFVSRERSPNLGQWLTEGEPALATPNEVAEATRQGE